MSEDGGFTVHCITIDAFNPYLILAGDVRIELTTLESKSSVIPFHQSPTILELQSALFAMLHQNYPELPGY